MVAADDTALLRVSTRDFPDSDRTAFWREAFARQMCRLEFEPLSDGLLDADATLLALPGLSIGWCRSRAPARWSRTKELLSDGDDDFAFIMPLAGPIVRSQRGQDVAVESGEAIGILHCEPGSIEFQELDDIALLVPRAALAKRVPDLEAAAARLVPRDSEALRLLRLYLIGWREHFDIADPALCRLAASHVHDLLAMALGATRDAAAAANERGVRAARLIAVKADIAVNLTAHDLSVTAVAARQRVTPRYVHMLFEREGTTFSRYVLSARLAHAHELLRDVAQSHLSIGAVAYASGFADLSHFNHAFRRRYMATPSEVRREGTGPSTREY